MLIKKRFKTADVTGCRFECVAYISTDDPSESRYTAMGVSTKTLDDLKREIAKIGK
jgi:hypothetical protein